MTQEQLPKKQAGWLQRLRLFASSIRGKIVLPYLLLTMVVAVIGIYVVTSLVASSLDERLTNHLLEAGRAFSDSLARQEMDHIESARTVGFTVGLAEALQAGDQDRVAALAQPVAIVQGLELLIVVDAHGQEMLHVLQQDDGSFEIVEGQFDPPGIRMVQALIKANDLNVLPKRALGLHLANQRYYHFTAIPVGLKGNVAGVVIVGTSLDTLLPRFKTTALADVIIYLDSGRAVATTFALEQLADEPTLLDDLSIGPQLYDMALYDTESTISERIRIRGRWYRLARGPLRVGNERLGVFAVALPLNFIIQAGATSRNTYSLLFTAMMACVIVIGYLISQRITRPLGLLVRTTQAVAEGNLEQRTGITSTDEIGTLATTFDNMTERLAERTRALEVLLQTQKEAASRMRAILFSIGDGVLLEGLDGNFIPLNTAAETMLEEMATSFLLGPLREMPVGDYDQISDVQLNPWLLEHRRFQVGKKAINAHSAAVRTDDGEYLGTVIVLRDVTAEAEADRLKDAFITHVSHELRTPLTAIKGYSELLLSDDGGALDTEQRSFLETIGRQTDNLITMINELLNFSEMEAGELLGLQWRSVLLSNLVEEVAEEWRPRMDEKGLTFQVEATANLPAVGADTRRLRWVVINLVRNAWQYTPTGGSVTLRLSAHDGQVILDVIDTGEGISPENQERLFSRFYRVTSMPEDAVRGLGLGLYVTKAIVEAHGGRIRVVSKEGVGSTFSVILPVMQTHKDKKGTARNIAPENE